MAFIDSASVRILCGELDDPPGHARGPRANYMALSGYADQDALVEVFGHVRARNPDAKVRYAPSGRVDDGDLQSHLVMLGNLAMLQTDPRLPLPQLPVHQVEDKHIAADGEVFEIRATRQRLGPTFAGEGQARHVVEDLGMIARTPSPLDPTRTLTIFSGVFTRGVHAAVRCLSDSEIGPENVCWLTERFGHAPTWGVLMRVQVAENAIATPRLSDPGTVTFTFPTAEE